MLIEIYLAHWNFENNQCPMTDNNCENNVATEETVKDNCQKNLVCLIQQKYINKYRERIHKNNTSYIRINLFNIQLKILII